MCAWTLLSLVYLILNLKFSYLFCVKLCDLKRSNKYGSLLYYINSFKYLITFDVHLLIKMIFVQGEAEGELANRII